MKSFITKSVMTGFLLLTCVGVANAAWECKVHNAKGDVWTITGVTRADASANAMDICVRHSYYARNCQISYCERL